MDRRGDCWVRCCRVLKCGQVQTQDAFILEGTKQEARFSKMHAYRLTPFQEEAQVCFPFRQTKSMVYPIELQRLQALAEKAFVILNLASSCLSGRFFCILQSVSGVRLRSALVWHPSLDTPTLSALVAVRTRKGADLGSPL